MDKKTILRFNRTLENYLTVSVGNDTYNLTKCNKIQITGTTINKLLIMEVIYYKIGLYIVMIKMEMVKYQISINQQKQTLEQAILEQQAYHRLVIVLCI